MLRVSHDLFSKAVKDAINQTYVDQSGRERSYSEQVYLRETYEDCKCFISPDSKAGVAVTSDKELVSLFSFSDVVSGGDMIQFAIENGADNLNCYDEDDFLPGLYRKFGFEETDREPWNPEYAPESWSGGTPDVVWMKR